MSKKKSELNSLTQAHAKQADDYAVTTLDQIWGYNASSRYQTANETEYEASLRQMTRSDLENHARAVGSIIVESSDRIRNELMKLFRAYVLSLQRPKNIKPSTVKITPEIQRILNEGR